MAGLESALLLINPSRNPGQLKKLRRLAKVHRVGRVVETESVRHFVEAVESFARGDEEHLLVWGGDGTAHEAINGLMRVNQERQDVPDRKSVGFLRGGTGNGIQDSYKVPYRISRQMANYAVAAERGYTISVDLLSVISGEFHAWCQLAGVGIDAKILSRRQRQEEEFSGGMRVPAAGFFNYITATIGGILSEEFRPTNMTLRLSEGKYAFSGPRINAEFPFNEITLEKAFTLLEAGTRPFYGKLFRICPDVVCNDGAMDLYLFNFASRVTVGRYLPQLWAGRHGTINARTGQNGSPRIERYEVKRAVLESPKPFPFHIDGELRRAEPSDGMYSVKLAVEPRALRFLVPPSFYRLFRPPQGTV